MTDDDQVVTARLMMAPMTVADGEAMVAVLADPALYRFTGGGPPTLDELRTRYRRQVVGRSADGTEQWFNWVARRRDDGEAVGYLQVTLTRAGSTAELAWVIGTGWQARGYATEGARAVAAWALGRGVVELQAHIHPQHLASEAVARGLGMTVTDVEVDGERRWRRRLPRMNSADWWKSAVVYQIYPRSFADSDGDGIGDLPGVTAKVDYLADLGVDVIWLSPIYPSPQDDAGYDISDYQNIEPVFGTLADFDALLSAVHSRGMKLVMDLVVNHTSDEHPWFVESRSSRDNPKRDWYYWQPPRPGTTGGQPGAEPTNWGSFFSGSTWQYDEATGEYYLHLFSRKQPDLDWRNPQVRQAVHAMMNWWLDRGVDGFRMDVINLISKVDEWPDGDVAAGALWGDGFPHVVNGPHLHEYLREMNDQVFARRQGQFLTVGETPGVTVEVAKLFTDPARRELNMVFQFELVGLDHGSTKWDRRPVELTDVKATLGRWQRGLAQVGWNSLFWDNHDQPRHVSRFGDEAHRVDSAKALATVLHLHRGTPYVYQGDELGMTNAPFAGIDDFRDIESINHFREATEAGQDPEQVLAALRYMGRDNARTPMQWDDGVNAGFTTGTPWIAVNPNHREINAAAALADPDSVWQHYRALIALRHNEPAVVDGDFTMLLPDHEQIYAFTRRLGQVELLVVANLSSGTAMADQVPDVGSWESAELVLSHTPPPEPSQHRMQLRPWEARVYRRLLA
jgi:oligo-1,6-glucosidase